MRKTFQAIYGSWAGTLIVAGRTDEEIRGILECSILGIECSDEPEAQEAAHLARTNILANLATLRAEIRPAIQKGTQS